jgi:hypothetical protein
MIYLMPGILTPTTVQGCAFESQDIDKLMSFSRMWQTSGLKETFLICIGASHTLKEQITSVGLR